MHIDISKSEVLKKLLQPGNITVSYPSLQIMHPCASINQKKTVYQEKETENKDSITAACFFARAAVNTVLLAKLRTVRYSVFLLHPVNESIYWHQKTQRPKG